MKIFLGSDNDESYMGATLLTPNGQRGITIWCGKLVFCASWSREVGRGLDLQWGDRELLRLDF
jgi:hypothetical protein